MYRSDGYNYKFTIDENKYSIVNYPGIASLDTEMIDDKEFYCFEIADGSKEYFLSNGKIVKSIDAFKNVTEYQYDDGVISKIIFPDKTSVNFVRIQDDKGVSVLLKYDDNVDVSTFATINLITDSKKNLMLDSVKYAGSNISFDYCGRNDTILLSSYADENKYTNFIQYDEKMGRIKSSVKTYTDGTVINRSYFYDSDGMVCRLVDDDFAEEKYTYTRNGNGSITVNTTKTIQGKVYSNKETLNKYGQMTEFVQNGISLKLKYNEFNAVSEEKEDNLTINYSYTPQGKVSSADFSDGNRIDYNYYSDGKLQKVITNNRQIYYTQQGKIEKVKEGNDTFNIISQDQVNIIDDVPPMRATSSISVLYNINSNVGVTNYHTYYNLNQSGFNCYSFAIGKYDRSYNPGYFSNRNINLNSLSGIKYNVEQDQKSLGRSIYDSTVNGNISYHSWKIALRIRPGADYHFMERSNTADSPWRFKAGVGGPVMQLLNGKTPDNITWDIYSKPLLSSKYKVHTSGYYNSSISYMIIRD